jgi:hypothetical protein
MDRRRTEKKRMERKKMERKRLERRRVKTSRSGGSTKRERGDPPGGVTGQLMRCALRRKS